ncbi:MAG: isoprenylcysteine carboxylmethyltransferase family protein [Desulfatirhabdiaceae bacterium]
MKYVILSALVISWCVLHSLMISTSVTEYLQSRLGPRFRFYRLFFNIISLLALIPVILYAVSVKTEPVFRWDGYLRIMQMILLTTAGLLFYFGSLRYDSGLLLGFKQIREKISNTGIAHDGDIDTSGILGIVRHPWYLGTMLLIWTRDMDISAIVVNIILTLYVIAGTCLEEKKLVRQFGEKYRTYQKRVSMFIPCKWLKLKLMKPD